MTEPKKNSGTLWKKLEWYFIASGILFILMILVIAGWIMSNRV
jgi:ABC-type antimicrobial peptide transport system permease subunit